MPHFDERTEMEGVGLEPIAIVGMSCNLPGGIRSSSSLWEALKNKRSVRTPKVPASRFNIDGYLHENSDRPGSFNVPGGYFLEGTPEDFDPTFFNISPIEAMWLDPQQRRMLEVTYECLESAGKTLDQVAGSNTAVYVGSFTSDFQQMSLKEESFRHNYAATGVDTGIISARLANVFDLHGPSLTLNTACSSSMYAIHNACLSLRARDCTAAIAGGVNLVLTVDQHMNTAKLGVLSPTSTCHTFDACADGYGRAEGAGALYLKRLADAIRDGDPVRGVIRTSAVNSNGKVAGMGITFPSADGQEAAIRTAYAKSGLDPAKTPYVECHGTGTPVGDPIETRAVAKAMNDWRPLDQPLIVGAVKANIGHSEAASGIFAVIKAALMTETGVIPGVCGLQNINPAINEEEWNIKVARETTSWPEHSKLRRAGVSSFGYGGTNGHLVVESVDNLYPLYRHGQKREAASYSYSGVAAARPYLMFLSAHDRATLERNISAHAAIASDYHLPDLAHTLLSHRTRFPVRGFAIASASTIEQDFELSQFKIDTAPATSPEAGFIFTGQGAQWPLVGAKAMEAFPFFLDTIRALDDVLQSLDGEVRPSWSIESVLKAPAETSKIGEPEIAQPICTAVQIAIVDLFARWGILPKVTVGHSSGEIAAAYAAGFLSAPEAIIAAFLRGYAVQRHAPFGSMLAVGLGAEDASKYIDSTDVVVACQNSPRSTTLSGTQVAIVAVRDRLTAEGIFARELNTGKAYHSPQMANVADVYDDLLGKALAGQDASEWRRPRATWYSSVTGKEYTEDSVPATYWSKNLRQRVLFDEAVVSLATDSSLNSVKVMLEVGPHSALAGPFKQICQGAGIDRLSYVATLVRKEDCARKLLTTAGNLLSLNYPVNTEQVNSIAEESAILGLKRNHGPYLLVDLPPYQWNYDKKYWAEARTCQEQRQLTHMRHDLLGSKIYGLSDTNIAWKNTIRLGDVPWIKDHRLGKDVVFPAAAHLSLACEALFQYSENHQLEFESVTFRNVAIKLALIIPETDNGIDIQLHLKKIDGKWFSFSVESIFEGEWRTHCQGLIAANHRKQIDASESKAPVDESKLTQRVTGKRWYDAFHRVGFEYGPSFQPLASIHSDSRYHEAAAEIDISTKSELIVGESRYLVHPSTIDGCLQLIIIALNSGLHAEMQNGVVPIEIEEMSLWPATADVDNTLGHSVAWISELNGRYADSHAKLEGANGKLLMDITNLKLVAYEAAVPQNAQTQRQREPYMQTVWKADIDQLASDSARTLISAKSEQEILTEILTLEQHKKASTSILLVGEFDAEVLTAISNSLIKDTPILLASTSTAQLELIAADTSLPTNVSAFAFDAETLKAELDAAGSQDVVITNALNYEEASLRQTFAEIIKPSISANGKLISQVKADDAKTDGLLSDCGFAAPSFKIDAAGTTVSCYKIATSQSDSKSAGTELAPTRVTICSEDPSTLKGDLLAGKFEVTVKSTVDLPGQISFSDKIIIDGKAWNLCELDQDKFTSLKNVITSGSSILWLTTGVQEGKNTVEGSVSGFLRSVRSEDASAKIVLLDIHSEESDATIRAAIHTLLNKIDTKESGSDTEYWLREGILHVPRVMPNVTLNDAYNASLDSVKELPIPKDVALQGAVDQGELIFQQISSTPLLDGEVVLSVQCASFETSDVQSQQISGPRVLIGDVQGQQTVAFAPGPFLTSFKTTQDLAVAAPGVGSDELAATLPGLINALNTIKHAGRVKANEHVLLLSASAGFRRAAAALSQALGFRLSQVSDVEAALSLLKDAKHAPNTVVSHEFNALSGEVWRHLPANARFVLNDAVVEGSLDALPFTKGATFQTTSLKTLQKQQPAQLGELLREAVEFVQQYKYIEAAAVYAVNDIKGSESIIGEKDRNLVVKFDREQSLIKIRPTTNDLTFRSDAAYLLVGGLGGLGRSLTRFMYDRGARDFVFLSRSGADKADAAAVVNHLTEIGAKVEVYRGDVCDKSDVEKLVANVTATRPISGVIHAAMVLQDAMFDSMTFNQWRYTVEPKVVGAQNLVEALGGKADLDFFVMTSSISATMGNPGQANYSAANSFLDALAYQCDLAGMPATSLILPMILDVGVVAENEAIEVALLRKAMYGIDEREMLKGFETAMRKRTERPTGVSPGASQLILGLEPAALASAIKQSGAGKEDAYWYHDARFSDLRATVNSLLQDGGSSTSSNGDFKAVLDAARAQGEEAVISAIGNHIIAKLSSMLLIPTDSFELDGASIAGYGLDSMIGADLRNWLFKQFGLESSFQTLLAPKMTVRALSTIVSEFLEAK